MGFSGRVFDPSAKEAKYINTSETPVYIKGKVLYALDVTKDAIQKANEAVLMEGELDVISSFQAGVGNVVAIKGSAVTEDHARLLRRFTERLVFALDSDLAGDAAARRGIEIAEHIGFDMRVVTLPSGKDPDEAARSQPGLLMKAIKDAQPIYDYLLLSAMKRFDPKTSFGKKKISDEFLPVLLRIDNPIVQGHYLRELATRLNVPEETVQESLAKVKFTTGKRVSTYVAEAAQETKLTHLERAELYILALLLQGKTPVLYATLLDTLTISGLQYRPVHTIIERLGEYLVTHPQGTAKDFAQTLPAELIPTFDEAFLLDLSGFFDDDVRFSREWEKAVREVRRVGLKRQIEIISSDLRDSGLSDDKYGALQEKLRALVEELSRLEKGE